MISFFFYNNDSSELDINSQMRLSYRSDQTNIKHIHLNLVWETDCQQDYKVTFEMRFFFILCSVAKDNHRILSNAVERHYT